MSPRKKLKVEEEEEEEEKQEEKENVKKEKDKEKEEKKKKKKKKEKYKEEEKEEEKEKEKVKKEKEKEKKKKKKEKYKEEEKEEEKEKKKKKKDKEKKKKKKDKEKEKEEEKEKKKKKEEEDKEEKEKVESEESMNDEEQEESSECEFSSSEEESEESSEEMMLFDQLSDDGSTSDTDWNPAVSPQKTKRSHMSSPSPSPVKSDKSSSPASKRGGNKRKRFRSVSSDDKWHNMNESDIEPTQPIFRSCRTPGPQMLSMASYSPLQCFQLFFSSAVMLKIVENSNVYGAKCHAAKQQKWQNFSLKDFKSFLALVIYMGLLKCFNFRDYWRKTRIYSLPYPMQVMSSNRFLAINNALHLSHPEEDAENEKKKGTAEYDRLFKIKPLYDDIREACQSFFHPFQNISIDERMVASKARNGLKQYMKSKPTKWGYKLFVLADSLSGYTWDFFVYEGKSASNKDNSVAYTSVMTLANEKLLGCGYNLYMDNFYTSPKLFNDLLDKKIWACGTVRANRIKHSKISAPRGNIRWFRDDKLLFVEWKDRRDVLMCSTFHKAFNGDTVKRKVKGRDGVWTVQEFPVPAAVLDYNKFMGGVDLSDALIGYYTVLHKTTKWYRSFFYHFVDIAIVNSFILHQQMAKAKNQKPMSQKAFREALISKLAGTGPVSTPGRASTKKFIPKNSATAHMPTYICDSGTSGRRKCRLCQRKTPVKCVACDVNLCFVAKRHCFALWHKTGSFKKTET